jgi:hypothetical protein
MTQRSPFPKARSLPAVLGVFCLAGCIVQTELARTDGATPADAAGDGFAGSGAAAFDASSDGFAGSGAAAFDASDGFAGMGALGGSGGMEADAAGDGFAGSGGLAHGGLRMRWLRRRLAGRWLRWLRWRLAAR